MAPGLTWDPYGALSLIWRFSNFFFYLRCILLMVAVWASDCHLATSKCPNKHRSLDRPFLKESEFASLVTSQVKGHIKVWMLWKAMRHSAVIKHFNLWHVINVDVWELSLSWSSFGRFIGSQSSEWQWSWRNQRLKHALMTLIHDLSLAKENDVMTRVMSSSNSACGLFWN